MLSEEDVNMKKAALKFLLDYSSPEASYDPNRSIRTSEEQSLIFGNNSFVSFSRGMETNNQSPLVSESAQTFENQISETEFFDSETGKQLLLNDQVLHEKFSMQKTDCTGCSSWTFCSKINVSSIPTDFPNFKKKTISVGEFIGRFSETLSFSENQGKPFLTSTPNEKRKSKSMSSLLSMEAKESSHASFLSCSPKSDDISCMTTPATAKPLKFSTPKWTENNSRSDDFHYFIGSVSRKNIQRLQREEKRLRGKEDTLSLNSLEFDKTLIRQSRNSSATGSDTITRELKSSSSVTTNSSMNRNWFVEPQLVILNPNKGNRVQLVNGSNKNLKFKTTFDSRKMNVCPLSGTVPALDKIGLRICISQYAKKRNESFEDDVKIVIGKNEKNIQVKFIKEEKSKYLKERSYVLF